MTFVLQLFNLLFTQQFIFIHEFFIPVCDPGGWNIPPNCDGPPAPNLLLSKSVGLASLTPDDPG